MNEDQSDETSETDTMGGPAHDAPEATSARALCEIAGKPSALDSGDLFGVASNAIKAWDELTDTTHPRAFQRMKEAIEKLRDAVEDHQADEAGRAYIKAYPRDDEETPAERYDREVFGDEWNTPMSL